MVIARMLWGVGLLLVCVAPALADSLWDGMAPDSGKLLATAGVVQIEGAGGGGLVPWALITGYGTRDSFGANVHGTYVRLPSFTLGATGVAVGIHDRLELSYTHQWLDTGSTGRKLGLGAGYTFEQEVAGAKLRLFGDAVYDQDSVLPQVALGLQLKANGNHAALKAVGARDDAGVDVTVAATKLLLRESLLLDVTLRATRANQFGLLGFGGDRTDGYTPQAEASAAWLLDRHVAIGAEFRTKPDNLRFAREDDAFDAFVVWFPTKAVSVTLAYLSLGQVARQKDQHSFYLALQAGF
jgi:hypothetical protein